MDRRVEIEAAGALLDVGVSLPLLRIRLPWRRRPVEVRLTMRRPCLGSQIRMARLYMETGVTLEEMRGFNRHEELAYMAKHGKKLSRMVALTICRGKVSGLVLAPVVAWMLRWLVDGRWVYGAGVRFAELLGVKPFMNIIGSVERVNPLRPRTSQGKRGS